MAKTIKCKQCRNILIDNYDDIIVSGHGNSEKDLKKSEICGLNDLVWYLNVDNIPEWIKNKIDESSWVKGRLNCLKCDARIGSFDFKSGSKCKCEQYILPSVSLTKSKVDIFL